LVRAARTQGVDREILDMNPSRWVATNVMLACMEHQDLAELNHI
jgi:hypothetical protein